MIHKSKPATLPFMLNQSILASIMFLPQLNNICLVGTGGGAIARFFNAKDNRISGDCIESEIEIINFAKKLFWFPTQTSSCWSIIHQNAQSFLFNKKYDLIVTDISYKDKTPKWITSKNNLSIIWDSLSIEGCAVFNIIFESNESFMQQLRNIRLQFKNQTLCFQVPNFNNILIYGFKSRPKKIQNQNKLIRLSKKWGINFSYFYQLMLDANPKDSGIF